MFLANSGSLVIVSISNDNTGAPGPERPICGSPAPSARTDTRISPDHNQNRESNPMRKTIAAAVLCAFVPNVAFAAGVCPTTGTLQDYSNLSSCTFTNGGNSWDLSNFGFLGSQEGYGADPTLGSIKLTLGSVGGGFSMKYETSGIGTDFFSSLGSADQDVEWTNSVWITGTNITQISNSATVLSGNSYESFSKMILDQSQLETQLAPNLNILFDSFTGTQTVSNAVGSYGIAFNIKDRIVFDSKTITATATQRAGVIGSYTNTFLATPTAVPEPATVALLAAGLLGIGVVSRRRRA